MVKIKQKEIEFNKVYCFECGNVCNSKLDTLCIKLYGICTKHIKVGSKQEENLMNSFIKLLKTNN